MTVKLRFFAHGIASIWTDSFHEISLKMEFFFDLTSFL